MRCHLLTSKEEDKIEDKIEDKVEDYDEDTARWRRRRDEGPYNHIDLDHDPY